jgi:hypothetical protein
MVVEKIKAVSIGTKMVELTTMNRAEYIKYRGWELPVDDNGKDEGYLVEYLDGGASNDDRHAGYISWSPKDVADRHYRPVDGMTFGMAIEAARLGYKISRAGWNGKGMWVVYMSGMSLPPYNTQDTEKKVNDRTAKLIGENTPLETLPYFAMWTVNAEGRRAWLPGWLASQTDMLAEDWGIV